MEKTYFYLTITGHGDAHQIKEQYNLNEFQAYNQGDDDESYGYLQYQTMCLTYPYRKNMEDLNFLLNSMMVGKLLNLPKEFKITLYGICHSSTEHQSHGIFIDVNIMKDLALLGADVVIYGKLHYLPLHYDYPNTVHHQDIFKTETQLTPRQQAYLSVHSYRYQLDDIAKKLGFNHNDHSYNFGDITRTGRVREFSRFYYQSFTEDDLNEKIKNLAHELYEYKENILTAGNDLDISYRVIITGDMPDEYQLTIAHETLLKFAEMRMSLDFDMYFDNSY